MASYQVTKSDMSLGVRQSLSAVTHYHSQFWRIGRSLVRDWRWLFTLECRITIDLTNKTMRQEVPQARAEIK